MSITYLRQAEIIVENIEVILVNHKKINSLLQD